MLEIVLNNGTVYENNPEYGWNLDNVGEILGCLKETGKYWLAFDKGNSVTLYKDEIKEVRIKAS